MNRKKILITILLSFTFILLISTAVLVQASDSIILGVELPGPNEWDVVQSLPDGTTFTVKSYLENQGFTVDLYKNVFGNDQITLEDLLGYDAIIMPNNFFQFEGITVNQDVFIEYVDQGGGLVLLGFRGDVELTLDEQLGFHFLETPWSYYVDASITDDSHPVMDGVIQLPKAGGMFVDWDALIDESPLPLSTTVLARTSGTGGYYSPNDKIALIAFEYGQGRVVVGPYDGLLRPYGPTSVNGFSVISEPVIENKLLPNAIDWVSGETSITSFTPPYDPNLADAGGKTPKKVGANFAWFDSSTDSANGIMHSESSALSIGLGIVNSKAYSQLGDSWVCTQSGIYEVSFTLQWLIEADLNAVFGSSSVDAKISASIVDSTTNLPVEDATQKIWTRKEKALLGLIHYTETGETTITFITYLNQGSSYEWYYTLISESKASNKMTGYHEPPSASYGHLLVDGSLLGVNINPATQNGF